MIIQLNESHYEEAIAEIFLKNFDYDGAKDIGDEVSLYKARRPFGELAVFLGRPPRVIPHIAFFPNSDHERIWRCPPTFRQLLGGALGTFDARYQLKISPEKRPTDTQRAQMGEFADYVRATAYNLIRKEATEKARRLTEVIGSLEARDPVQSYSWILPSN